MAGLLRSLLTIALIITLVLGVASIALAARNAAADNTDTYKLGGTLNQATDDLTHVLSLLGACLVTITALLGIALVFTRNLHRRYLHLSWVACSLASFAVLSMAIGIWSLFSDQDLTRTIHKVTIAVFCGSLVALGLSHLLKTAKCMEEYAVGHK